VGGFRYTRSGQLIRLNLPTDFTSGSSVSALTNGGRAFGLAFSSTLGFTPVVWEADGSVTKIVSDPPTLFSPAAVNEAELVVGTLNRFGNLPPKAAIWRQGVVTTLGTLGPGDLQSSATAVNSKSQVVGTSQTTTATTSDVFLWTESGGMQRVGRPTGAIVAVAGAINDCGVIAGTASTAVSGQYLPWRWTSAGGFTMLPLPSGATVGQANGIDSLGVVYGNVSSGGLSTPYIWYRDHGEPLPGGSQLVFRAVNSCGMAVGTYQGTANDGRLAEWTRPGC
jgi:uncharacterized membrane protein